MPPIPASQIPATANYRTGSPGCGACRFFNAATKICSEWDAIVAANMTCDDYEARVEASRNFTGIEIARTGSFEASTGPVTFTTGDFENAEKAYKALVDKHKSPIKLGHDDDQVLLQEDGYPNAGFLKNIHRDGDRLVADMVDVPDPVAELIEQGRFNTRSIEALRNARIDGKKWPFVITGLALLGADLPAVDSLKDVVALYAKKGIKAPQEDGDPIVIIGSFSKADIEEVDVEALIGSLHKLLERTEAVIYRRGGAPRFRTLVGTAVDELRAIAKKRPIKKEAASMDPKTMAQLLGLPETATEADITTKLVETTQTITKHGEIAKLLEANAAACTQGGGTWDEATLTCKMAAKEGDKDKEKDAPALAAVRAELATTQREVVVLKDNAAKEEATKKVDLAIKARKFTPASRDTLIKLALSAPTEFDAMAKATPNDSILKSGEAGQDGEGDNASDFAPNAEQMKLIKATGLSEDEWIEQRAKDLGKPIPEAVTKRLVASRSAKK